MTAPLPFRAEAGGVRVAVRVTPKAGNDSVDGLVADGSGRPMLKARVAAAPDKGAANAALIGLLARAWDLPKSRLSLVAGAAARTKTVHVEGQPDLVLARLEAWARTLGTA